MADTKPIFKVGQILKFKKYAEQVDEPIFEPGDFIKVMAVTQDSNGVNVLECAPCDESGKAVECRIDGEEGDQCYADEVEVIEIAKAAGKKGETLKRTSKSKAEAKTEATAETKPVLTPAASVQKLMDDNNIAAEDVTGTGKDGKILKKDVTAILMARMSATAQASAEAPAETATEEAATEEATTPVQRVTDTEAVLAILEEKDALEAAKSLAEQVDRTYFTLGGVLSHIFDTGAYKAVGFTGKNGFKDYVESQLWPEGGYSKARYLINIYNEFRKQGATESLLDEIGWSKAKELVRIAKHDPEAFERDFEDLCNRARSNNRLDLIEYVKTTYLSTTPGATRDTVRKVARRFAFLADAARTIDNAIARAREALGTDDVNAALEHICGEWIIATEGVELDLQGEIARLEAKFGVTIIVPAVDGQSNGEAASTEMEKSQAIA